MSPSQTDRLINALLAAYRLKHLPRTGWLRLAPLDLPEPRSGTLGVPSESVAAHTWGLSYLVCVLLPPELDQGKALLYATVHDLPEALVGDLTPRDGVSKADKHALESTALNALGVGLAPAARQRLQAAWHTYEARTDPESLFVKQLDALDMALQACLYAERLPPAQTGALAQFWQSAAAVVHDPSLTPLMDALRDRCGAA